MRTYRIAHISDLHLSNISLHPKIFFSKKWIGTMNLLFSRQKIFSYEQLHKLDEMFEKYKVDRVVISGDLTSTSSEEEFEQAKKLIDSWKLPMTIIPGNHDAYTRKVEKRKIFYKYFAEKPARTNYPGKNLTLEHDRIEVHPLLDKWYIIALDTAVATSWVSSRGKFSEKQERDLTLLLKEFDKDEKIIMVNHFSFFEHESIRKKLIRCENLKRLIRIYPQIKIYLHGHTHSHIIADLRGNGYPIIMDSGSTSHNTIGRWNLLELTEDTCKVDVFKWQKDTWTPFQEHQFYNL